MHIRSITRKVCTVKCEMAELEQNIFLTKKSRTVSQLRTVNRSHTTIICTDADMKTFLLLSKIFKIKVNVSKFYMAALFIQKRDRVRVLMKSRLLAVFDNIHSVSLDECIFYCYTLLNKQQRPPGADIGIQNDYEDRR